MVVTKHADSAPLQPDFGLRHPIGFTNLDKLVFRQSKVTRRDVLEYYNQVADYLLPWLKDRPLSARLQSDAGGEACRLDRRRFVQR